MQAVLECDAERSQLLLEEKELLARVNSDAASAAQPPAAQGATDDAAGARLQQVYARLQEIEADGAPARAASILAGLSFDVAMQQRATKTFSGGAIWYCLGCWRATALAFVPLDSERI